MKRAELFLLFLELPLDFAALLCAAAAAYALRFTPLVVRYREVLFQIPFDEYLPISVAVAIGWVIATYNGLITLKNRAKEIFPI